MPILTPTRALLAAICAAPTFIPLPAQSPREAAFAAAARGAHQQAAEQLYRLIRAGARDQKILTQGAASLEKAGRFNDASEVLGMARKTFPDAIGFRVDLARVYSLQAASMMQARGGKMDSHTVFHLQDAIRETSAVLKLEPGNRDARLILAHCHHTLGEWDKARTQSEELTRRFPKHPGGHILMGDLAFHHFRLLRGKQKSKFPDAQLKKKLVGSWTAAHNSYQQAIRLDAGRTVAHRKLGDVFAWNGQRDEALAAYGKALATKPEAKVPHSWITQNIKAAARFKFYEKLGHAWLAAHPKQTRRAAIFAWYAAAAQLAQKKYRAGEQMYLQSVTFDPSYLSAYYYAMYSAYYYREDYQAALKFASQYAAKDAVHFADVVRALPKSNRESVTNLLTFLAKQALDGGAMPACRDLNHVLAALQDTADAWNNYAFLARETGQYPASEKGYRHALEIEPDSGQLKNDLGVILHYHSKKRSDWLEAEKLYRQAIKDASRVLKDGKAGSAKKKVARQTVQDATGNLKLLGAQLRLKKGR